MSRGTRKAIKLFWA